MNICEANKNPRTQTNSKFVIKYRASHKNTDSEQQNSTVNEQDIHQFITYMLAKSKRLKQYLEEKKIDDEGLFSDKHLYSNPCMVPLSIIKKALLRSILDRLFAEKRLGKNLKGMNKSILNEIENLIWSTIMREVCLYSLEKSYQSQKLDLETQIEKRKENIEKQIEKLGDEGCNLVDFYI